MRRRQSRTKAEWLTASALILCGLIAFVVSVTPRVAVTSAGLPAGRSSTAVLHKSEVAAIVPAAVPRACTMLPSPASKAVGSNENNEIPDDVRFLAARRLVVPVAGVDKNKLYDSFDDGRGSAKHHAIDIHAARGTPVLAAGDGCVVKLFRSLPGGITLYQFDPDGNFAYYYAHLDRYADDVKEGSVLQRGDVLGYVGTTGNAPANAPHLHFAIFRLGPEKHWWKGVAVNPYTVFTYPEPPMASRP